MVPRLRLVQLVALGAPLWLISLAFPAGWAVGASYLVILAIICLGDYRAVSDTAQLELAAINAGADALICTEKDLFNLRDAFPLALPVYVCRIRLVLPDAEGFWRTILTMIERRQDMSA